MSTLYGPTEYFVNAPPAWASELGPVDVAVGIHGHARARRALINPIVAFERRNEPGDAVLVDRTDPDAVTPVRVVVRARLRVDHIDGVALNKETTGAAPRTDSIALQHLVAICWDGTLLANSPRDSEPAFRASRPKPMRQSSFWSFLLWGLMAHPGYFLVGTRR
jgi:hypothetical protein